MPNTLTEEQKASRRASKARYREANREKLRAASVEYKRVNRERILAEKAAYYAANKEKAAAYKAKYQVDKQDAIKARNADYREANREQIREYNAVYREANKDRIAIYNRSWSKNNPEKANHITARRRSQKLRATVAWGDSFAIAEVYHLAELRKRICGGQWNVDHIVPLQSKLVCGLHCEFNLRVIPRRENISKSNRTWPDMPC